MTSSSSTGPVRLLGERLGLDTAVISLALAYLARAPMECYTDPIAQSAALLLAAKSEFSTDEAMGLVKQLESPGAVFAAETKILIAIEFNFDMELPNTEIVARIAAMRKVGRSVAECDAIQRAALSHLAAADLECWRKNSQTVASECIRVASAKMGICVI